MNKSILVSVILASYNHVDYIDQAINSVLNQEIHDLELIVVDDGSTDGTPDRVANMKDPRLNLIYLKENRRYHPRNIGLSTARGKYIAFQNSDDIWKAGKLKKQIELLEARPSVSACFTGIEIVDENSQKLLNSWATNLFTTDNRDSASWLRHLFDFGNCLCISSAVIRNNKFKEIGQFKPNLIQLSDFDLWIRLAAVGEFNIIGEKLTCMRVIENKNLSGPSSPSTRRRTLLESAEVLERYLNPPVFNRLPEAFHDIFKTQMNSRIAILGGLALHAWKLSPAHVLLGNKIIAEIINDASQRDELIKIYGTPIIHQYIEHRGELDITTIRSGRESKSKKLHRMLRKIFRKRILK